MKTILMWMAWGTLFLGSAGCAYFKKESDRPWNEDLHGSQSNWLLGPGAWVNGGDSWSQAKPGLPQK
jgi:hypothetical protein